MDRCLHETCHFLYRMTTIKSLLEISIDGFFNPCNSGEEAPFCYFTILHYWINVREIAFLCDCKLICKEDNEYCCSKYLQVLFHCPKCVLKKCRHCRRLEHFNTLYAHLALNRTFEFRHYLLDLWSHITKYKRYYILDETPKTIICLHTSLPPPSTIFDNYTDDFFYKTAKKLGNVI